MYDVIIIGNGPAGITSSIYLKRFGHNVLVIGKDSGALTKAEMIENYYALGKKSGKEIINLGLKQALELGVTILHDEVLEINFSDNGYNIKTIKGNYSAKIIVIATGKARNSIAIASKFEGSGISYCATCDGFFYKNKKIAVVGYNEFMNNELKHLANLTNDITIYTNGNDLEVEVKDFKVIKEKIIAFEGNERLESIVTANSKENYDGCFIALGSANAFSLAKHLGLELDSKNNLVVNNYETNMPNIYACGDVIGGILQITKATYDGMMTAYNINDRLRGK